MGFYRTFPSLFTVLILGSFLWANTHLRAENPGEEWILTRSPSRNSWIKVLAGVPEFEFMNSFGRWDQYALIRLKSKLRSTLPQEILALQKNHSYQALENSDPLMIQSWGLSNTGQDIPKLGVGLSGVDVGAFKSWGIEKGNKKVIVAILDTGIDLNHEDLKTNLWKNPLEMDNQIDDDHNGYLNDISGWNFVADTANIQDDNNHGTAVAGVIAADANNGKGSRGLIEQTSLMVVKILDENGMSTTERAVKAIEYAVKNGATILNASWGGSSYDQILFDTIQWANSKGVLVVCAAGNDAKDNDLDEHPVYPASFNIPNVISVAAHDSRGQLASFSNYGKETVHLAAPGMAVYTTVRGGYQWLDGTSFAVPFVSAVAALLKSHQSELTAVEIKNRILSTAVPMDYYMKEKLKSAGRLSAENALKNVISPKPSAPTVWRRVVKNIESLHPYANDTKQVIEISQPGATHIRVHFSRLDLEKQYDQVFIKDKEGRLAQTYSGKIDPFWSADVLGDSLRLEFVSDFSNTEWGFAIDGYEFAP